LGGRLKHLDWDDFRLFVAVARIGSFTRAARELRVSEPTVSRRVKRLESMLGAKLFEPGRAASQLTSEGKRILNYAIAAEHSLSRAATVRPEHDSNIGGECRISVGDGTASYWLPQFLAPFLVGNPHIELMLFTTQDRGNIKRPVFDLQIQYAEPVAPDLVPVRLGTLHFVLLATVEYLAAHGRPARTEDLARHRIIDQAIDLAGKSNLSEWAGLSGRNALVTNSNTVLGETVCFGGGIGLLPSYATLVDPRLVPIMPDKRFSAPLFVCFERDAGKKPAVRAMIDYLKDFVFDRQRMPWFFDSFVAPQKGWKKILDACLARASEHCSK
jgi:molybdate transport repressor ModE-like protein